MAMISWTPGHSFLCTLAKLSHMTDEGPTVVTREELTEELARHLDVDAQELREESEAIDLGPPWTATVVEETDV